MPLMPQTDAASCRRRRQRPPEAGQLDRTGVVCEVVVGVASERRVALVGAASTTGAGAPGNEETPTLDADRLSTKIVQGVVDFY